MSRLERERWAEAQDRWPTLQSFLSQEIADVVLGDARELSGKLKSKIAMLDPPTRSQAARECWEFLNKFKDRHDDYGFVRDGFGVLGKPPPDNGGRGHRTLARMRLLYDHLAEAVRSEQPDWKPTC